MANETGRLSSFKNLCLLVSDNNYACLKSMRKLFSKNYSISIKQVSYSTLHNALINMHTVYFMPTREQENIEILSMYYFTKF
jgi:hypothetical protein